MALLAERVRHTENMFHIVLSILLPCLHRGIRRNLGPSVPARVFCSFPVPSANAVQCS